MTDRALELATPGPVRWRQYAVTAGRIALALLLLLAWKLGADIAGPLYVADPLQVFERIVVDTWSGALIRNIYVTLRISAIGVSAASRPMRDVTELGRLPRRPSPLTSAVWQRAASGGPE